MMIEREFIEAIVNQNLDPVSEFLVELNITTGNKITVLIDGDNGITIDQCVKISKAIEGSLDREKEDFELEVSSAGLSSPLKLLRQFTKNIGKNVDIVLKTGEKYKGQLTSASENHFTIEYQEKELVEGKKRKQLVQKQLEISYADAKSVHIAISFR